MSEITAALILITLITMNSCIINEKKRFLDKVSTPEYWTSLTLTNDSFFLAQINQEYPQSNEPTDVIVKSGE